MRKFVKNAIANLGRGSAAAVVAVLLPPILVRHMPPVSYAVWVLVLQTAAYASYLNFGLQTAIGRYVAYANEKQDANQRDSIFSTAFVGLCGAALVALLCLAAVAAAAPLIFPGVPAQLVGQMRYALLLVGISLAIELPASAWNGVMVGMQRFDVPAVTIGGARLLSALGVIAVVLRGGSLLAMAAVVAAANLLSYMAQYLAVRRIAPDVLFRRSLIRRSTARELSGYCFGLTMMSFSMLLVNGFDLVLVGRFEFPMVTPYSVSISMITLISGLLYAVINVLMPHAVVLHAREKAEDLGQLLIVLTRFSVVLLAITAVPIALFSGQILRLWIGWQYAAKGAPVLAVLIVANVIRLAGAPYSILLIAAGKQRAILLSPLLEGFTNLLFSIALGVQFGAIGVAAGTFIGAIVGLACHLFYNMPKTLDAIQISWPALVRRGIVMPVFYVAPFLTVLALTAFYQVAWLIVTEVLLSILAYGFLFRNYRFGHRLS